MVPQLSLPFDIPILCLVFTSTVKKAVGSCAPVYKYDVYIVSILGNVCVFFYANEGLIERKTLERVGWGGITFATSWKLLQASG